ncbi:MAG: PDZ domain-containing protein, partial [Pirellulales bacterium]|nr:PDZ domain-containing protein [Pirellulales bacterium]
GLRASGGPRDGDGVTVANVSASSPAAREGLKPGDRVVRVGSQRVDDRLDFALAMLATAAGEPLHFEIERGGERLDLTMKTEGLPGGSRRSVSELAWDVLGIQAKPVADSTMRRLNSRMRTKYRGGLYVTAIRPGSPADEQGLSAGDVLLGIHGWQTSSLKDLAGILEHPDIQRGPRAKFYIVRREQTLFGHFQLAAQPNSKHR